MTLLTAFTLAAAVLALAATPGPGVFAVVARALSSGLHAAILMIAGIVLGDLIFLLLAIYGLAGIADHMYLLFLVIKYCGAAYLIYLGIQLWQQKPQTVPADMTTATTSYRSFSSGLLITLGNPKVILFYLGFLPAFVNLQTLTQADVLMTACVVTFVLGTTLFAYALVASRARHWFYRSAAQQVLHKTAGGILISTGTLLATKTGGPS